MSVYATARAAKDKFGGAAEIVGGFVGRQPLLPGQLVEMIRGAGQVLDQRSKLLLSDIHRSVPREKRPTSGGLDAVPPSECVPGPAHLVGE